MSDYPKPGPELDVLVAERVMGFPPKPTVAHPRHPRGGASFGGWICLYDDGSVDFGQPHEPRWQPPSFSTNIAAAWEVVEKLDADGRWFTFLTARYGNAYSGGDWVAAFDYDPVTVTKGAWDGDVECEEFWHLVRLHRKPIAASNSAPHAICLAALIAMEKP